MKKGNIIFWIMGLCAFVALMCNGLVWALGLIDAQWGFLSKISTVAGIILTFAAVIAGWIWISSAKFPKILKLVLEVLFIVFAVLAIFGHLNISF